MEEQTIVDIPRQTHEPAPVEGTSDAANRRKRVDESSSKPELYEHTLDNKWDRARAIYDEFPEMVRIPLTTSGDTALHVAVMANNSGFVKELVNLEYMTPEDLEIRNVEWNTAFYMAAMIGNIGDFFQIMIEKNENLPLIRGQDGMLPVHLAVLFGNYEIARDLTSENLLQKMDLKDIRRLFFMAISSSMYGVANKLLEKYPEELVVARNDREETALHMLVRLSLAKFYMREKNNNEISSRLDRFELLTGLCYQVSQLEDHKIIELITHPSVVLFDAVKSGNIKVVEWLLSEDNREILLTIKDPENGRNLLHFAVLYKEESIFGLILWRMRTVKHIMRTVDKNGNNVLHLAALQPDETSSSSRPNIQMQRELVWFKEVEKKVPPELRAMRNRDGKTPQDIFNATQRKISNEMKEATKAIANYGMVVATLIATIAFAAAVTVPGDKNNGWFIVFILTNAVALFTSSASIISFLSISTPGRYTQSGFGFFFQRPSFILGITYISIATMVIAFVAASFLIFGHLYKWVAYVVASMGLLPILMSFVLQSGYFYALRDYLLDVFWISRDDLMDILDDHDCLCFPIRIIYIIYSFAKRMVLLARGIISPKREGTANT